MKIETLICRKDKFDYNTPTADSLFRTIMFEPHQLEREVLLKNKRKNSLYTIKITKIENITCDGNGIYLKTRTNNQYCCLLVENCRVRRKIVHSSDNENFYFNKKNGHDYEAIQVALGRALLLSKQIN